MKKSRDLSFPGSGLEEGHFGSIDSRHALMLFKSYHFEFLPQFQGGWLSSTLDLDRISRVRLLGHFYTEDPFHGAHRGKTPYEALLEKLRW
jgi:hypothetical protein